MKNAEWMIFDTGEKWRMNILIWPNGSGKSNFLEIINQVISSWLIKTYIYRKDFVESDPKKAIDLQVMNWENLTKNVAFLDKKSQVSLTMMFNRNDYDNFQFLCKYRDTINDIIAKYSTLDVVFPHVNYENLLFQNSIDMNFAVDVDKGTITLQKKNYTLEEEFILLFVQHIHLIQICMNIYNDFTREASARKLYPLKNTFAILGSDRNLNMNSKDLYAMSRDTRAVLLAQQNTRTDASIGYKLCMSKIVHLLKKSDMRCDGYDTMKECIDEQLIKLEFYVWLQEFVYKYLGLRLSVVYEHDMYKFVVVGENDVHYELHHLSSGEQSFLLIMLTLYGYDMQNGLMIIDEPELHLHPQMQKKFISMIQYVSTTLKMQFIIATHSPLMINETTIQHVYKFSHRQNLTRIVNPPTQTVTANEANLIHMLKFENVAKIFFVDRIIMVEWETDAYFFEYYIQYLIKHYPDREERIKNYEIININGKWSYRRWQRFLKRFGLEAYYVGDWDNVIDTNILPNDMVLREIKRKYPKKNRAIAGRYGNIVYTIQRHYPTKHKQIVGKIQWMYDDNVFILKKWDLETYLHLKSKWLEEVIDFCSHDFYRWFHDPAMKIYRQELEEILAHMFPLV